jgi:hypothetical protein
VYFFLCAALFSIEKVWPAIIACVLGLNILTAFSVALNVLKISCGAHCFSVEPFENAWNNVLVYVAQYTIFASYAGALAIETDLSKGLNNLVFGSILVFTNLVIIGLAFYVAMARHRRVQIVELQKQAFWRPLSTKDFATVNRILGEHGEGSPMIASHHLLNVSALRAERRVGVGAFGEVYKGVYRNEDVAIKKIIKITELNVRLFREEILLTAKLQHPNIVTFWGACWCRELVCLVLEWVPKGSLADMLGNKSIALRWGEPLLRVAIDVAKGMQYLHSVKYQVGNDGQEKECILVRLHFYI